MYLSYFLFVPEVEKEMSRHWTVDSLEETLDDVQLKVSGATQSYIETLFEAEQFVRCTSPRHRGTVKEFCTIRLSKPRKYDCTF